MDFLEWHDSFSIGIPKVDEQHKQLHGNIYNPVQVANFLKNWLTRHILGTDMKFGNFINGK